MIPFIKMWLILRALEEQEEREVEAYPYSGLQYSVNRVPFVYKHNFATAISNLSLLPFWLPLYIRRWLYKDDVITRGGSRQNKLKLRRIYLLLEEAHRYTESPNPETNLDEDKEELKCKIRLSGRKSEKPLFITSYWGGFGEFIRINPEAWAVVIAVILSPYLLSLLNELTCRYLPMLEFCNA